MKASCNAAYDDSGSQAGLNVNENSERSVKLVLGSFVILYLIFAIATAASRQPYPDEAEINSPPYMLVHHGYLANNLWEEFRDSHKAYWLPPMFFLSQAVIQLLIGFGIVEMRLGPVLWGVIVLINVYQILRRIPMSNGNVGAGSMMALFAVGALAVDYTFIMHPAIGRCESMSLAMAMSSFNFYLMFRESSPVKAMFWSHFCMAAAAFTHPTGAIAFGVMLITFQIWLDRNQIRWSLVPWIGLPYCLFAAAWGFYILQEPESFRRQLTTFSLFSGRLSGLQSPLSGFTREISIRLLDYYGVRNDASASPLVLVKLILPVGYLLGIGLSLTSSSLRRDGIIRLCLAGILIQYVCLSIGDGSKQYHYTVYYVPLLTLILARVLFLLCSRMPKPAFTLLIAGLAVVQMGPILYRVREDRCYRNYIPVAQFIKPYVENRDLIVSEAEFGVAFGYPDNFVTDYACGYKRTLRPKLVVADDIIFANAKNLFMSIKPDQYRYLDQEFPKEDEVVFQSGTYKVYRRRT